MATGNQVLPGAPATGEHAAAAQAQVAAAQSETAQHGGRAGPAEPAGNPAPQDRAEAQAAARGSRPWPGAGGRWLIWVLRVVLWTVLLLIGYRGVAVIVMGYAGPGGSGAGVPNGQSQQFPAAMAQAYAYEFGQVYLRFSPATAAQRAASLATFLPPGTNPQFGWNGGVSRSVQSEQVAGIRVVSSHRAVVTLLARVNGNFVELGVPIYASRGALVVSGYPALLPAPEQVAPPTLAAGPGDQEAKRALHRMLGAFFRAFASGDAVQLSKFTAAGGSVTGLGGVVSFGSISRLSVPAATGPTRRVTATVVWRLGPAAGAAGQVRLAGQGAALTMSYTVTVVRHLAGWLVLSITAAAKQPWPTP
jgi:Conjugative transposon protein TcpC